MTKKRKQVKVVSTTCGTVANDSDLIYPDDNAMKALIKQGYDAADVGILVLFMGARYDKKNNTLAIPALAPDNTEGNATK